jgi:ATP-binding cassette subfamily F protein uup
MLALFQAQSTFVRVISGEQPIDSGSIEAGETVIIGVYDQMGLKVDRDLTVLEFVTECIQENDSSSLDTAVDSRRLLRKFEFPSQRWNER